VNLIPKWWGSDGSGTGVWTVQGGEGGVRQQLDGWDSQGIGTKETAIL